MALFGYPGEHRVIGETRCFMHTGPNGLINTLSRTERLKNPMAPTQEDFSGMERTLHPETLKLGCCCFRCSASKRAPFFQRIKVIAAIFLAKARRAIAGFLPLASKAS